jgi:hypothetical protein
MIASVKPSYEIIQNNLKPFTLISKKIGEIHGDYLNNQSPSLLPHLVIVLFYQIKQNVNSFYFQLKIRRLHVRNSKY